jgi:hypothetical protein
MRSTLGVPTQRNCSIANRARRNRKGLVAGKPADWPPSRGLETDQGPLLALSAPIDFPNCQGENQSEQYCDITLPGRDVAGFRPKLVLHLVVSVHLQS